MNIIQPYTLVQGDYGQQLNFVIIDGQGNAVNLTGVTLAFKAQAANDPTQTDLTLTGTMTVDNATAGQCHYTVGNGDFSSPGTFVAQITITGASSKISVPNITILVIPSLPQLNN